ncbi:eukaryotic peptide chain release factor GTP-binding subunit ERF3A-like isoform X2 [Schistocerca gregaria]|nr:eukaryotic peptide chain release factor GTP-binding subunit ERF3A-like isoform X2 [Schistocerca gregaria]
MITERIIEKYTKEAVERKHTSWFLSYIMDALEEERSKGKTIEVGRARFLSSKRRYTILDAPGHKNYVPNMLVGLCQADIAILIISARKGEFESGFEKNGQTREHVFLARAMGIRSLIICINKMDDPTVNWSKTRYDDLVKKIVPFLQNTRYNIKRDVSIIPISGQLGYNIKTRIDASVCPWYTGNSLIETLDSLPCSPRDPSAPLRMPILDRIKDMGIIAMGKIEQGTVVKNRQYVVVPGNAEVEITKIETEESVDSVAAGEIAHLTLKIADESQIARGSVICDAKSLVNTATDFVAQVVITDLPSNKVLITSGSAVMLHIHAVVTEASFVRILVELDKKTGEVVKKLPKFARVKSVINVHIQVPTPIPIEVFKEMPQLGRFVIRDEDTTVGFGQVIHLGAPRLKRGN